MSDYKQLNLQLHFDVPWEGKNIFVTAIWVFLKIMVPLTLIEQHLLAAAMEFIVDFSLDISQNHLKALESSGDTASSKDRHVAGQFNINP